MRRTILYDAETIDKTPRSHKRGKPSFVLRVLQPEGNSFKLDGRSVEGRLVRDTNNALLEQLGRKPNSAERLLIERLSWLHLIITYLDARVLAGEVGYEEAAAYASHINSFSRGLTNLGLLGSSLTLPTLDEKASSQTRALGAVREAHTRESVENAE